MGSSQLNPILRAAEMRHDNADSDTGNRRLAILVVLGGVRAPALYRERALAASDAAWLSPVFLLLFIQSHRARVGLGIGFLVQLGAFFINWWEIIPVPGAWYYLAAGIYATAYFLPFAVHRWLAAESRDFRSTLILPVSWVTVELLLTKFTPYGTWASLAYTQVEHLPLLQIASVTGLAGISFLILWFAAICGWLWQQRHCGSRPLRRSVIYLVVLLTVLAFGEARMFFAKGDALSVRVASLTPSADLTRQLYESMAALDGETTDDSSLEQLQRIAERLNSDLLRRSHAEAQAGAEVIVWSEHAARVTAATEAELIRRAQDIAREFSVLMVLGVGAWHPNADTRFENKAIIMTSEGEHASTYWKAKPIVGQESSLIEQGEQTAAILDTDRARFATAICHDLDFADFVRQVGRNRVDILLGPSSDWDAITHLHPRMAVVRSVENGCSLVRPCGSGLSLAVDAFGRVLARQNDYRPEGGVMISHVPTGRRTTLYPTIGDLFAYLNLVAFVFLLAKAAPKVLARGARRSRETRNEPQEPSSRSVRRSDTPPRSHDGGDRARS
jgi:apolipoprotein N-acyltransferase